MVLVYGAIALVRSVVAVDSTFGSHGLICHELKEICLAKVDGKKEAGW